MQSTLEKTKVTQSMSKQRSKSKLLTCSIFKETIKGTVLKELNKPKVVPPNKNTLEKIQAIY